MRPHRIRACVAAAAAVAAVAWSAAVAVGDSTTASAMPGRAATPISAPAAVTAGTDGMPPSAPRASDRTIELGGVTVHLRRGTRQVVTVNATQGWHARVGFWRRTDAAGWRRVFGTRDGRTGYGGLVPGPQREQGTGTTPLGSYRMTESFGLAARPAGTRLPFHRVRAGDYWVQDNRSRYYNQLRNRLQGGFRWRLSGYNSSERLRDYPGQYRWSVVIDFNRPRPVRHRGSGIFLHVNGDGATAGCVSTPRPFIRQTLQRLRPRLHPVVAVNR